MCQTQIAFESHIVQRQDSLRTTMDLDNNPSLNDYGDMLADLGVCISDDSCALVIINNLLTYLEY